MINQDYIDTTGSKFQPPVLVPTPYTGPTAPALGNYNSSWKEADQPSGGILPSDASNAQTENGISATTYTETLYPGEDGGVGFGSGPETLPISLVPTVTTGTINNPIIPVVQSVVPIPQSADGVQTPASDSFSSLLSLFDSLAARNIPSATPASTQAGTVVVPGASNVALPPSGNNYTGILLIVAVVSLLITFVVYRKKIVSEIKDVV